jgi:hypothetical protein
VKSCSVGMIKHHEFGKAFPVIGYIDGYEIAYDFRYFLKNRVLLAFK